MLYVLHYTQTPKEHPMPPAKTVALNLRISPEKKAALVALAEKNRLDMTKLVVPLIDQLIEQNKAVFEKQTKEPTEEQGIEPQQPTKQLYFYPFPGDDQRLNRYAAERQLKTTTLIRLIIRAWLTREPLMPKHELAVLGVTSNQLGALGRNLNQLVKQYYAGNMPMPDELQTLLESTVQLTQQARKDVGDIVKANNASWENDHA
jgi:hypothetical protein